MSLVLAIFLLLSGALAQSASDANHSSTSMDTDISASNADTGASGVNCWGFNSQFDWSSVSNDQVVPNQYIVTLRQDVDPTIFPQICESHRQRLRKRNEDFAFNSFNFKPLSTPSRELFNAVIATIDDKLAEALKSDPRVEMVVQDKAIVTPTVESGEVELENVTSESWPDLGSRMTGQVTFDQKKPNTWHLDRIDQRYAPLDGQSTFFGDGRGVVVYVVDSGVNCHHRELFGRCINGFTLFGNDHRDQTGHGSHVAGTIAGTIFGVGKQINIVSVRVFGASNTTSNSNIIQGIYWSIHHAKRNGHRAVMNLSVGSAIIDPGLNRATEAAHKAGITVVAAAGNSRKDACQFSPSVVKSAIVVGATTIHDTRAPFSNYGSCVDVFAPGQYIFSIGANNPKNVFWRSGTSMAAPIVSGVAALYLSRNPSLSPADVEKAIVHTSTKGVITGLDPKSPNGLVYAGIY